MWWWSTLFCVYIDKYSSIRLNIQQVVTTKADCVWKLVFSLFYEVSNMLLSSHTVLWRSHHLPWIITIKMICPLKEISAPPPMSSPQPKVLASLCLALVVHRLPLILVLPWLGCGCAQASSHLVLAFTGLWLLTGFPQSWSCLCGAVVVHRLPWSWSFLCSAVVVQSH